MTSALLSVFYVLFVVTATVSAADIEQVWTITYREVRPDGVNKTVPVVNGQYPGPILRGRTGQSVRIEVRNQLEKETTSIHWHGLKQVGTPWSDGVPGITNCPILPGETFVYEFNLDAPGTLWWHSHSAFQKSSLYGAIIVDGDESSLPEYDEDRVMLLNDWFHENSTEVAINLLKPRPNFKQPTFNSLLVNGKGMFNCSSAPEKDCEPSHPEAGPFVLDVEPGKTYRLRIVGAATDSFINFGIEGHKMTVVEVETTLLKPYNTRYIEANAGQSYSVLFSTKTQSELNEMPQNNGIFWMTVNTQPYKEELSTYAILRYSTAPQSSTRPLRPIPDYKLRNWPNWSLRQARRQRALRRVKNIPKKANRRFSVLSTVNFQDDGKVNWAANNITFVNAGTPVLHAVKLGMKEETSKFLEQTTIPTVFDYTKTFEQNNITGNVKHGTHVIKVKKDEVIDFVFQNTVIIRGLKVAHPWHLHLHNFWVLGYGDQTGAGWKPADEQSYDLKRPVSRNNFNLFTDSWTAIRVKFNNPGVAFMHCHINPHLYMGMALSIQIGEPSEIPAPPENTRFCGTAANRT